MLNFMEFYPFKLYCVTHKNEANFMLQGLFNISLVIIVFDKVLI